MTPSKAVVVGGSGGSSSSTCSGDAPLVWIDCEMTGLDPDTDEILEIACIVTTANLDIVDAAGFRAVVHWPQPRLDAMGDWCRATHMRSGLTARVLASTTPAQGAAGLLAYVTGLVAEPRRALLAGNSVHADAAFLRRPPYAGLLQHLHYRLLDVSAIKEAARRWSPPELLAAAPVKAGRHRALDDILERYRRGAFLS